MKISLNFWWGKEMQLLFINITYCLPISIFVFLWSTPDTPRLQLDTSGCSVKWTLWPHASSNLCCILAYVRNARMRAVWLTLSSVVSYVCNTHIVLPLPHCCIPPLIFQLLLFAFLNVLGILSTFMLSLSLFLFLVLLFSLLPFLLP
jgi:hypothetical protein